MLETSQRIKNNCPRKRERGKEDRKTKTDRSIEADREVSESSYCLQKTFAVSFSESCHRNIWQASIKIM
jgi:hypothetical protein